MYLARVDPVDGLLAARGDMDPVVIDNVLLIGGLEVLREEAGTQIGVMIAGGPEVVGDLAVRATGDLSRLSCFQGVSLPVRADPDQWDGASEPLTA